MSAATAKSHPLQFSLRDYIEISAVIAPSAWCLTWPLWHPTDRNWLVGVMVVGGLLTFLISNFFRARGWAYSLLFTYAGGLAFVIWLPARAALRFPEVVSSEMHRVAILAMENGQFALASAGLLVALWLIGALTGHCLFRCCNRFYAAWFLDEFLDEKSAPRPALRSRILSAGLIGIDALVVAALFTWIGYDYSRPTIKHVRRIDPLHFVDGYTTKTSPFSAWTISHDGKRLLGIDRSDLIHDIAFSSGEDRLSQANGAPYSPIFSEPESISAHILTLRECREGLLIAVYQSSLVPEGLSFLFVDITSNAPRVVEPMEGAKAMRVLGLSPSGTMLVTQSRHADLPGASSLLVWNLETMELEAELDAKLLGGCERSLVLLDDRAAHFAVDAPINEFETGRDVTVYSRDLEQVAILKRVECQGVFEKPPLRFARSGKFAWGQFAGQRDFQSGVYPVIEKVVSLKTQNPIESASSEYGGLNLVDTVTLDPYHERLLRLDFASEFNDLNLSLSGEEVDRFPIIGVECRQQIFRRRLRLADLSRRVPVAMTTAMAPLTAHAAQKRGRGLYSGSLWSAQFSRDGRFVVTIEDHGSMGAATLDVWRLPAP